MFSEFDRKRFTEGYIEALLWSSEPDEGWPEEAVLSADLRHRCEIECQAFLYRAAVWIDAEPTEPGMARAGHDFALTRNGHGAGFWDGGWPVYGDLLAKIAKSFGEIDLYVSDGGELEA